MSAEGSGSKTAAAEDEKQSGTASKIERPGDEAAGASNEPSAGTAGAGTKPAGKKDKKGSGHLLPDLYDKFVSSFETALDSIVGSSEERHPKQVLPSITLEGVADLIRENKVHNVVVMCGAGISTSAGIPDFRSPGTGLYDNLAEYNLPDPMAIFEINFFRSHPEPFFTLAKKLFPQTMKPTICHYFIRLLDEKGVLRRCFTQNIDSLEFLAGIPAEKVVTAHGSHHTSKCLSCGKKYDLEWITEKLNDEKCKVPRCEACKGIVKPDIVFFGENLPKRFFTCALDDFPKCDLLIIMGTSLVVQPFASMVDEVKDVCPRLLINLTPAGQSSLYHSMLGASGLRYGRKNNYRDVFHQSTCDDGTLHFAELLGWKKELQDLVDREWAAIDRKSHPATAPEVDVSAIHVSEKAEK